MDAKELLMGRSPNAAKRTEARELPFPCVAAEVWEWDGSLGSLGVPK
jgi:hypothetical protein